MDLNFETALAGVLVHEGGYVNHPQDPGGATNKGITWRTYNAWRSKMGLSKQNVRNITDSEVAAIYRAQYWDAVRGDDLPSGLDYAVFDFAVNSGPSRAAKFLQRVLGVAQDGQIGEITLEAIRDARADGNIVTALCNDRLAWLKRLSHWPTFGKGWERRVSEVKSKSLAMVKQDYTYVTVGMVDGAEATDPTPGKAEGQLSIQAQVMDLVKDPQALGAAGGFLGGLATIAQGTGPVQIALAVVLVAAAFVGLFLLVQAKRGDM